jgi:hypothetical protein
VGKPEGKRSFGKAGRSWEDNIKINLQVVGGVSMAWIELTEGTDRWQALVNAVISLRVP